MKTVTDFPHAVVEYPDMGIEMPDGTRLSARVWMPVDAPLQPAPVILEHLPYRKRDGTIVRDQYTHPWLAGHGYVCIRTDMRGNGDSDGLMDDEYTAQELADAEYIINWAAAQEWCNGNVGMMGISWGGFNGLQVAALAPKPLKAVITICSTTDRYADDIHYKGGCLLGENFGWSCNMLSYSSRPPDPALVGDRWRDMWRHRLENMDVSLSTWLRHQHRDEYWQHGSVCEDYSAIKAAVLAIGGWHDGYRNTPSHLVENLSSPCKAIVGPWNHKYPHYAGPAPAIGFLQEAKRWFDQWLKAIDTGVADDPEYRAYLMDSVMPKRWLDERAGRWIAEQNWPSSDISNITLNLGAGGQLGGDGAPNVCIKSPADCGASGGEYFPFAFGDELPDRQNEDDAKSLCFDGAVSVSDMDIVGAPSIKLTLSADQTEGQIAVRLCDLHPDGTSALISYGVLNLTHANGHILPAPLVAGQEFNLAFDLDHIAYRLPAGHRLRVAISTNYFPMIWPAAVDAEITIHSGEISLPIRKTATDSEWTFEPPEAAAPWRAENLRPTQYSRQLETEQSTGETSTKIFCDFGENRDLEHGLISGGWMREDWRVHPDDPLSARVSIEWEQTGGREDAMWRTYVDAKMHCDATHFYFTAKLCAWENDTLFFEREFDDKVKRELV
ncbi:peptidase S15 [Amylibacter kogurei]|uniref:Peptidase S15 n=1 Tax=Paramylibacter kogurei TaxID=1889778 RepID=A0A2G5KA73_9RHOB|nr:CocE/NonD family hydrolase [Amylibacter kogurei]PIB25923.1 peptidase S15 [Amylibacter kogurei]